MNNLSQKENEIIAQTYGFYDFNTIVDIGGGTGGLLKQISVHHPGSKSILYDLDSVINQTEQLKHHDHISLKRGSFFESIPTGGDLYILKRILHDWNDTECITILNNLYKSMTADSRLLIIEAMKDTSENTARVHKVDILLMTLFGGRERSQQEFAILLNKTGFVIRNIIETDSLLSIIEVEKK